MASYKPWVDVGPDAPTLERAAGFITMPRIRRTRKRHLKSAPSQSNTSPNNNLLDDKTNSREGELGRKLVPDRNQSLSPHKGRSEPSSGRREKSNGAKTGAPTPGNVHSDLAMVNVKPTVQPSRKSTTSEPSQPFKNSKSRSKQVEIESRHSGGSRDSTSHFQKHGSISKNTRDTGDFRHKTDKKSSEADRKYKIKVAQRLSQTALCDHHNRQVEYNCFSCEEPLCKLCAKEGHKRHHIETVEEALERLVPEIQGEVVRVKREAGEMDQKQEVLTRRFGKLKKQGRGVLQEIDAQKQRMQTKISRDRNDLKKVLDEELHVLKAATKKLQRNKYKAESLTSSIQSLIQKKNGVALMIGLQKKLKAVEETDVQEKWDVDAPESDNPPFYVFEPSRGNKAPNNTIGNIRVRDGTATPRNGMRSQTRELERGGMYSSRRGLGRYSPTSDDQSDSRRSRATSPLRHIYSAPRIDSAGRTVADGDFRYNKPSFGKFNDRGTSPARFIQSRWRDRKNAETGSASTQYSGVEQRDRGTSPFVLVTDMKEYERVLSPIIALAKPKNSPSIDAESDRYGTGRSPLYKHTDRLDRGKLPFVKDVKTYERDTSSIDTERTQYERVRSPVGKDLPPFGKGRSSLSKDVKPYEKSTSSINTERTQYERGYSSLGRGMPSYGKGLSLSKDLRSYERSTSSIGTEPNQYDRGLPTLARARKQLDSVVSSTVMDVQPYDQEASPYGREDLRRFDPESHSVDTETKEYDRWNAPSPKESKHYGRSKSQSAKSLSPFDGSAYSMNTEITEYDRRQSSFPNALNRYDRPKSPIGKGFHPYDRSAHSMDTENTEYDRRKSPFVKDPKQFARGASSFVKDSNQYEQSANSDVTETIPYERAKAQFGQDLDLFDKDASSIQLVTDPKEYERILAPIVAARKQQGGKPPPSNDTDSNTYGRRKDTKVYGRGAAPFVKSLRQYDGETASFETDSNQDRRTSPFVKDTKQYNRGRSPVVKSIMTPHDRAKSPIVKDLRPNPISRISTNSTGRNGGKSRMQEKEDYPPPPRYYPPVRRSTADFLDPAISSTATTGASRADVRPPEFPALGPRNSTKGQSPQSKAIAKKNELADRRAILSPSRGHVKQSDYSEVKASSNRFEWHEVNRFEIDINCWVYRMCIHEKKIYLPASNEDCILVYSTAGEKMAVLRFDDIKRPWNVKFTRREMLVSAENGIFSLPTTAGKRPQRIIRGKFGCGLYLYQSRLKILVFDFSSDTLYSCMQDDSSGEWDDAIAICRLVWSSTPSPLDTIAPMGPDSFVVCSHNNHRLTEYDSLGQVLETYGTYGQSKRSNLWYPLLCDDDNAHALLLADTYNHVLKLFGPNSDFETFVDLDHLSYPRAATVDCKGVGNAPDVTPITVIWVLTNRAVIMYAAIVITVGGHI